MKTDDGILVLETEGLASDLVDSPSLRTQVSEIKLGTRSPLIDLSDHLKENQECGVKSGNQKWAKMAKGSFLMMVLMLTVLAGQDVSTMVFNEAKATPVERSRLWCRRFAYCNTALFGRMSSMPEYGDFPDLPIVNEDNLVGELSKHTRNAYPKNDPAVSMNC